MNIERRVWIASALSAVLLVLYSQTLSRQVAQQRALHPIPEAGLVADAPKGPEALLPEHIENEEVITLESHLLKLDLGKQSAAIKAVTLKGFKDISGTSYLKFGTRYPVLLVRVSGELPSWKLASSTTNEAKWTGTTKHGPMELRASLDQKTAVVSLDITSPAKNQQIPIQFVLTWNSSDPTINRYNMLEAIFLTKKTAQFQRHYLRYSVGVRQPLLVPRGTSLITLSERYFCQSLKPDENSPATATLLPTERGIISVSVESVLNHGAYHAKAYAGPRDFFHMRDGGFEQAFPRGFLAKIGLMLMVALNGLAGLFGNYGVAVIVLAASITCALSPFTLVSLRSMKKMQELQPRIDQLKKKHASDPTKLNQETFSLFREHRVSPLSGCLPMMLQLPIFFALWSAISQTTGLRGERFLWIDDLSLPDRLARIGGFNLNILPILMSGAMFVQTKLSQARSPSTPQTAIFSGPLMSVMFGVMFYQVPSGLVLYWLTNSLVSIFWYRVAKL